MKKLIPIIVLSMMLSGCGALEYILLQPNSNVNSEHPDNADRQETQPEKNESKPPQQSVNEGSWSTFQKSATIEETVLVDEYDVRITATELSYDNYSAKLGLVFENNSEKELSFISNSFGYSCNSVNGYMVETGYLNCNVAAGKKAKATISFDYDLLMLYGIYEIADIEIGFDIEDDDYNHNYSGPRQIKTSIADSYDYELPDFKKSIANKALQSMYDYKILFSSDKTLYDQNGVSVVSSSLVINTDGDRTLMLEVKNTSAQSVVVSSSEICLNSLEIYNSTWSSNIINPGKTRIFDLGLSDMLDGNCWDVYGLQEIGEISFSLNFKNVDGNVLSSPAVITVSNPSVSSKFNKDGREVYNANNIRIVMKDIVESDSEYRDDMYILLFVENNTADTISLRDVYDSFSLNGYMMDCSMPVVTVKSGTCSVLEIRLWESDLEENDITSPEDINEIEFSVIIRNSYQKKIDEAVIHIDTSL